MDTQALRVFAAHYVVESDIESSDKLDLLGVIKIAEKDELLSLLSFGELTEVTTENINLISETEDTIERIILDEGLKDNLKYYGRAAKHAAQNKSGYSQYASGKARQAAAKAAGVTGKVAQASKDIKLGKKGMAKTAVAGAAVVAAAVAAKKLMKRNKCKKLAAGDSEKYKQCMA